MLGKNAQQGNLIGKLGKKKKYLKILRICLAKYLFTKRKAVFLFVYLINKILLKILKLGMFFILYFFYIACEVYSQIFSSI